MSESPQEVSVWERQRALWRDNHVGLILAVMLAILIVGMSVLAYRQNRFRPPRFPDSRALHSQSKATIVVTGGDEIPESEALSIRVSGAANPKGSMYLAIYESATGFNEPDKAIARLRQGIVDGQSKFVLRAKDLPAKVAIAAYHDENEDGELNHNAIGIPTERYGFSGNARGTFGPPPFNDCVIDRPASGAIDLYIR